MYEAKHKLKSFPTTFVYTIPPPDQYIFFGLTENGRQNRSTGAKTGLLRRVNHGTPAACVIGALQNEDSWFKKRHDAYKERD